MAADEYDSYIGDVYALLRDDARDEIISDHLRAIEIERMGFAPEQVPKHLDIAKTLKQIPLS